MISLDNDDLRGVVEAAYDHVGKIKDSELTSDIIKILVASEMNDSAVATKLDDTEMEYFASRVCKMIKDEFKKLSGNDKQVRFDFRSKRVALSHYLQFGPAGYERLRESSLETLPSQMRNEYILSHL